MHLTRGMHCIEETHKEEKQKTGKRGHSYSPKRMKIMSVYRLARENTGTLLDLTVILTAFGQVFSSCKKTLMNDIF